MLGAATLDSIIQAIKTQILNPLIYFLMALATVIFIWGVIGFMANAEDAGAREDGKRHIIWGVVGIVIMVSAFGIINLVASIFH